MRYRGLKISDQIYKKVRTKIQTHLDIVSYMLKIPLENLTCYDIERYFTEYKNYEYVGHHFSDKITNYFAGDITIENGITIIGYNINPKINIERQNFTKMHETAHSIFHLNNSNNYQTFKEIINLSGYSDNEKIMEIEADFGSSICMINDKALYFNLIQKTAFQEICRNFYISSIALKLRIKNFLYYNYGCSEYAAEQFVSSYISNNKDSIYNFIKNSD